MPNMIIQSINQTKTQPVLIVPIIAKKEKELISAIKQADQSECDLIEWRIDHYEDVKKEGAISKLTHTIKELTNKPLLITFRTYEEGGNLQITEDFYASLYQDIIQHAAVDLIDIELYLPAPIREKLIIEAKEKNIEVVVCHHNFNKTPSIKEMVHLLEEMENTGANICKLAVMPQSPQDVLNLMEATYLHLQQAKTPLITMSMGDMGKISRIGGHIFGSSATFGALDQTSAPGQIGINDLAQIIEQLTDH